MLQEMTAFMSQAVLLLFQVCAAVLILAITHMSLKVLPHIELIIKELKDKSSTEGEAPEK